MGLDCGLAGIPRQGFVTITATRLRTTTPRLPWSPVFFHSWVRAVSWSVALLIAGCPGPCIDITGRQHAGENLEEVLARRRADRGPPIQMCDALSRNLPKELEAVVANCLAHGRRNFVGVFESFPEECLHVLEKLGEVYKTDAEARERGLDAEARLLLHQARSGPVMEELKTWFEERFENRLVEPNSRLGKAITYVDFRTFSERGFPFMRLSQAPR